MVVVARPEQVSTRGIEGAPLLVVEVLSPSTTRHDRGRKARRYAALGIPHYWIVDPDARRIEYFELTAGDYESRDSFEDLVIDFPALWR